MNAVVAAQTKNLALNSGTTPPAWDYAYPDFILVTLVFSELTVQIKDQCGEPLQGYDNCPVFESMNFGPFRDINSPLNAAGIFVDPIGFPTLATDPTWGANPTRDPIIINMWRQAPPNPEAVGMIYIQLLKLKFDDLLEVDAGRRDIKLISPTQIKVEWPPQL